MKVSQLEQKQLICQLAIQNSKFLMAEKKFEIFYSEIFFSLHLHNNIYLIDMKI